MPNTFFLGISVWLIVKIAILILMGMYLVFALIVIRQIRLMTSTLALGYETFVIFLGYIHLIFAVVVFLAALVLL